MSSFPLLVGEKYQTVFIVRIKKAGFPFVKQNSGSETNFIFVCVCNEYFELSQVSKVQHVPLKIIFA